MSRLFFSILTILIAAATSALAVVDVVPPENASPRAQYGVQRLREAIQQNIPLSTDGRINVVKGEATAPEGFMLSSPADATITVAGSDDSGVLYGCLELAERITETKQLPAKIQLTDAPAFKLRGPCIGMQKTNLLPGRRVYEYPYTAESFPFFYDKAFWTEYLDFLATNRFNTLYLWNGHPFSSLVKLDDYPYALEVSDEQFAKNVEMYRWIATECDRRGIWLVQMFYNILISKPFAERNGLETQLRAPDPKAADYTRKSIAEFVKQYPHVGLMICMGEALQGTDNQKEWLIETILPGIQDGMKLAGLKQEPPVVIRTHATDLGAYMADALKVYKNLYTEAKFNGESLTTWEPRGKRQEVHLAMSKLGSTHLMNVHILANLEPFRYGDVSFIQKSVQAGRDRLGAKGLHLYPLFYWGWPDAPDKVAPPDPPLKQWRRDWIWFEAWGRYAWNPDIDQQTDVAYWIGRLTDMYGTKEAAAKILDAYCNSGECALRILRRFGITEGNRQTMSLGMTLSQLTHPEKFNAFEELWESQSPPGERIQEYVQREWEKKPHEGETPPRINQDVLNFSKAAVDDIDSIEPAQVTKNAEEFARLKNDVHCIRAMSQFYAAKTQAAMCVLRHELSHDSRDLVEAEKHLAESVEHFRKLAELTKDAYRFANSMQTSQRRIPLPGGRDGKPANYHWTQMLPVYEKELADFRSKVSSPTTAPTFAKATITWRDTETFDLDVGAKVFTDRPLQIESLAPALKGLIGIRTAADGKYTPIEFETTEPVRVLIGYFRSSEPIYRKVPNLETDALAAEHGGQEVILPDALKIASMPPVDVHALSYGPGKHKLDVRGGDGIFLILGAVKAP